MNSVLLNLQQVFFCVAVFFACSGNLVAQKSIDELSAIQDKVQKVVDGNMESCVAISDRFGFGSGVIVNSDGLILTAGHVVSSRQRLDVIFPSGRRVKARALGRNLSVDAGMVQITEPGPWPGPYAPSTASIQH